MPLFQDDPRRSMIARVSFAADRSIDAGPLEARPQRGAQQQMVYAKAGVPNAMLSS
jgi:hypothetical protein